MFRDKNILMATQIWCWVGCCWKQRLCSRTRWNNYCTKPRNATSLRNASAKSSGIWRSQAGCPTSPTSQAGHLPTSVYLSEKALLGGAIGHRLDPADILRLSYPCCPWLPFPQLLWHYLLALALRVRQGPRLSYWDGNAVYSVSFSPSCSSHALELALTDILHPCLALLVSPCYSLQQPFLILLSSQFEESFWWFWMTVCPLLACPGLFIYWIIWHYFSFSIQPNTFYTWLWAT